MTTPSSIAITVDNTLSPIITKLILGNTITAYKLAQIYIMLSKYIDSINFDIKHINPTYFKHISYFYRQNPDDINCPIYQAVCQALHAMVEYKIHQNTIQTIMCETQKHIHIAIGLLSGLRDIFMIYDITHTNNCENVYQLIHCDFQWNASSSVTIEEVEELDPDEFDPYEYEL